jgi:hypothetical protein
MPEREFMKRLIYCLICLIFSASLFADNPDDYFSPGSAFYTFCSLLKFSRGMSIKPEDIEGKTGYKGNATNNVDYYISLIIKAYKINMRSMTVNDSNIAEADKIIESCIYSGLDTIVTYYKNNKSHCAMITGISMDLDTRDSMDYKVSDSALENGDSINADNLTSEYWKVRVKSIYYFIK